MKNLLVTFLVFIIFPFGVSADINCNAKVDEITEQDIGSYLRDYGDSCIDAQVDIRIKNYGLDDLTLTDKDKAHNYYQAWNNISMNFAKLAKEANENSIMKIAYTKLAARASMAKQDIQDTLELQSLLARHGSWQIPAHELYLENVVIEKGSNESLPGIELLPHIWISDAIKKDCSVRNSAICTQTLEQGRELMLEWSIAANVSLKPSAKVLHAVAKQVSVKNAMWDRYLFDSKPMLPPDFFITDCINGDYYKSDQYLHGFPEPHKTQWFFLHPSVGVEYVSGADEGSQLKPVLLLELIGANRWNEENRWIDVPVLRWFSGFSVVASYADRAGVTDVGIGGLFTFNNVYSIGVTNYSGDIGFSVSMDLANLWRKKYKPDYEKYKNAF